VAAYERPGNLMKVWSTSTWQEASTFSQMTERVDYHDAVFTPEIICSILATLFATSVADFSMRWKP
jgi:hypothetical protein